MGYLALFDGILEKPIAFFENEPVEVIRQLLQSRRIWCSAVDYVVPFDGSLPGAVFSVKRSQYSKALEILREYGIL